MCLETILGEILSFERLVFEDKSLFKHANVADPCFSILTIVDNGITTALYVGTRLKIIKSLARYND